MSGYKPKIVFELEHTFDNDRTPWHLTAYRKTMFGKEYIQMWWFKTEAEAIQRIEDYKKIPLLRVYE